MNSHEPRGIPRDQQNPAGIYGIPFFRGIPPAEAVWGAFWGPWALLGRPRRRLGLSRTLVFYWFYKGFARVGALWGTGWDSVDAFVRNSLRNP